ERSRRDVEHRQASKSRVEQEIHEYRYTAAHVNYVFLFAYSACLDELKRGRGARLIPTHVIVRLGLIDTVPMLFDIHGLLRRTGFARSQYTRIPESLSCTTLRLLTSPFQNGNSLDDHRAFIFRDCGENSSELLLARPGKLSSCFSPLSR